MRRPVVVRTDFVKAMPLYTALASPTNGYKIRARITLIRALVWV